MSTTKDAAMVAVHREGLQQLSDAARRVVAERDAKIASLLAKNADLITALEMANQRLNESGTGEMGLLDTIHATAAIIRAAIGKART